MDKSMVINENYPNVLVGIGIKPTSLHQSQPFH